MVWFDYSTVTIDVTTGTARAHRDTSITAVDAETGLPVNLRQDGTPVGALTSDADGLLEFQAEDSPVVLATMLGQTMPIESIQAKIAKGTFTGDLDDAVDDGIDRAELAGRLITPATAAATYSPLNVSGRLAARKGDAVVNVKDYGAVGDGTADDTTAIANAVTAAATLGTPVFLPAGTYRTTAVIPLTSGVTVRGEGGNSVIDLRDHANLVAAFEAVGTQGSNVNLTANATAGAYTLTMASTTGFAVGDWVLVSSTAVYNTATNQPLGELARVESLTSTVLTLADPLQDTYTTAATAKVNKITMVRDVTIEDLTIIGDAAAPTTQYRGILLERTLGARVSRVRGRELHYATVHLIDSTHFVVDGCDVTDARNTGLGYGIGMSWACQDGLVTNLTARNVRHATTIGGSSGRPGLARRITIANSVATQTRDNGFDLHASGEYITFANCTTIGSAFHGIYAEAGPVKIIGCTALDSGGVGIMVQANTIRGLGAEITGCTVERAVTGGIHIRDLVSSGTGGLQIRGVTLQGNRIHDVTGYGIYVLGSASNLIPRVSLSGNIIGKVGTWGIQLNLCQSAAVGSNTIDEIGAASDGVVIVASPDTVVTGNRTQGGTYGIRFVTSQDSVASGNRCKGASAFGIYTPSSGASNNLVVVGNKATISLSGTGHINASNG